MRAAHVGALYDGFSFVGLQYGPGYRTLAQAWGGDGEAAARLRARATREGAAVHPADLDDALCTGPLSSRGEGGGSREEGGSSTRLPFAVEDALLQRCGASERWAVRGSAPFFKGQREACADP